MEADISIYILILRVSEPNMRVKTKDLRNDMNDISITVKIVSIEYEKYVNTIYGKAKVARAVVEDETGKTYLTLWNEQINKVKEGSYVQLEKAYVTSWKGIISLNVGRRGKITLI